MRFRTAALAILLTGQLGLAGCGGASDRAGHGAGTSSGDGTGTSGGAVGPLRLVASFYPLQWTARQVAGSGATVESLTKPGAEPHDLELTPQDVGKVVDATLVVYLKGFQPAVDAAVGQEAGGRGYDVSGSADLTLTYTPVEGGRPQPQRASVPDPHFWLDPLRLARVADALASRLATADPGRAATYRVNAQELKGKLRTLDRDYRTGLSHCANQDLVTTHNAFGYLAQRYGLRQVGITGLAPENEPKPADLAEIADFVRKNSVRTIYYETLVSPTIARTVGNETGAATDLLDPIEGLTGESRGSDYLQVMRSNLATIRKGQPCS